MEPLTWLGSACVLYTALELRAAARRAQLRRRHARAWRAVRGLRARDALTGRPIPVRLNAGDR